MGLREAFISAARVAFNVAGNVKIDVTYTQNPDPSYNEATGVVTENKTEHEVVAIREDYEASDIDSISVYPTDIKLLILYEDLSISPELKDYVEIGTNTWNLINFEMDPARVLWTFQVRK